MSAPSHPQQILAIDPGRDKCGVAIVNSKLSILEREIVSPDRIAEVVSTLMKVYAIEKIIIGDATTSDALLENLKTLFSDLNLTLVDEKNSTLEARSLYWKAHPPRGWRRVLPLSLQLPPVPIDDFAAVVLARRYFGEIFD